MQAAYYKIEESCPEKSERQERKIRYRNKKVKEIISTDQYSGGILVVNA
jgi:hypothetical protein